MNSAPKESHVEESHADGSQGLQHDLPSDGSIVKPLIVGVLVASALGYTLLSYALSLLAMLGLFFFMLFGLIIGAAMYRSADKTRVVTRQKALLATVVVVFVGWSIAIIKEAVDFQSDFVESTIKNPDMRIPRHKVEEVKAELREFIAEHMKTEYPPGGLLGYFKMVNAAKTIEFKPSMQAKVVTIKPRVQVWVWWTRVLLALLLLYISIWSQVSLLTKPPKVRLPAQSEPEDNES